MGTHIAADAQKAIKPLKGMPDFFHKIAPAIKNGTATTKEMSTAQGVLTRSINKLGKQYTIHFLAYTTMNAQVKRINNAFSGRSDQIIYDIFTEINDNRELGRLMIDTRSITKGKYNSMLG